MFKKHPKGLIAAAMANMGERFGFYTMMGILLLFLQAKFGLDDTTAGFIYSTFYFAIYILAFVGGMIADKTRNYKGTILMGLILMAVGYAIIAFPTETPVPDKGLFLTLTCVGLFVIAFGNGLFKGNLQALVGQMYDDEKYSKMRDSGFSLFYMFINVGAIFAPLAAIYIRSWWVKLAGFEYNPALPELAHGYLNGTNSVAGNETFAKLAAEVSTSNPTIGLTEFANSYLNVFNEGFHYAFAIAIGAMLISLVVYIINKRNFPNPKDISAPAIGKTAADEMGIEEVRQRIWALVAVFAVVIFFWFSFHQNGVTLTLFAKDYTDLTLFGYPIAAEIFQSFNPFFVVFLTPVVLALFGWMRAKGIEPSTPKKIAIGMAIAASAFGVMAIASYMGGVPDKAEVIEAGVSAVKVTPWLLIITYLILTVAELFISPLGISFVSKVAPPKYQGLMQGGWLAATAVGNQLLFIGVILYNHTPIWFTWTIFITVCLISMFTMIFMLKWLERVSK